MSKLKAKLLEKIEAWRPRTTALLKQAGDVKLGDVTIGMAIGGARGVKALGYRYLLSGPQRGHPFPRAHDPRDSQGATKVPGNDQPYVEGLLYLLLTGDVPTAADAEELTEELRARAAVPHYVFDVLRAMPRDSHPMTSSRPPSCACSGLGLREAVQRGPRQERPLGPHLRRRA